MTASNLFILKNVDQFFPIHHPIHYLAILDPRSMINSAKQWATSRGLVRRNEVHQEEEFKIPTSDEFEFSSTRAKEAERHGSMEVEDPDGTLFNFGDITRDGTIMYHGNQFIFEMYILYTPSIPFPPTIEILHSSHLPGLVRTLALRTRLQVSPQLQLKPIACQWFSKTKILSVP